MCTIVIIFKISFINICVYRATVLVEEDYETRHCECRIKDIACALW